MPPRATQGLKNKTKLREWRSQNVFKHCGNLKLVELQNQIREIHSQNTNSLNQLDIIILRFIVLKYSLAYFHASAQIENACIIQGNAHTACKPSQDLAVRYTLHWKQQQASKCTGKKERYNKQDQSPRDSWHMTFLPHKESTWKQHIHNM